MRSHVKLQKGFRWELHLPHSPKIRDSKFQTVLVSKDKTPVETGKKNQFRVPNTKILWYAVPVLERDDS